MSYNVFYECSNGERFELLKFDGLRLKDACFHDFSWTPAYTERSFGGIITEFTREDIVRNPLITKILDNWD
jgi:hypothetical protein